MEINFSFLIFVSKQRIMIIEYCKMMLELGYEKGTKFIPDFIKCTKSC